MNGIAHTNIMKGAFALIIMHADLAKDGACDFVVKADGAEIYRSGRMTAQIPARKMVLDISTVEALTLKVEDANDGATFWHKHAFWGQPKLCKAKKERNALQAS